MSRPFRVLALLVLAVLVPACNDGDDEIINQIINVVQPPPPPAIAILTDVNYVEYNFTDPDQEGSNVHAALILMGLATTPVFDISEATLASSLPGRTAFVIPEQENGNIEVDITPGARERVRSWTEAGGTLLFYAPYAGYVDFLNTTYGFALAQGSNVYTETATLIPANAAGTAFEGGPPTVFGENYTATVALASLPPNAVVMYEDDSGDAVLVVIPYGQGRVVIHGYDWWNAQPIGVLNNGWMDLLRRTVAPLPDVALFSDSAYVDYSEGVPFSEASNVQAGLEGFGLHVTAFTGITGTEWGGALQGKGILVLPELENGALAPDLDDNVRGAIYSFVLGGGTLIAFWTGSTGLDVINSTFGMGLTNGGGITLPISRTAAVNGTAFAGGPATLPDNNATTTVAAASLPGGSLALYTEAGGAVVVARIPFGAGRIVLMGWDWFDAAPVGSQDGGWIDVLRRATQD